MVPIEESARGNLVKSSLKRKVCQKCTIRARITIVNQRRLTQNICPANAIYFKTPMVGADNAVETLIRMRGIYAGHRWNVIRRYWPALSVDNLGSREAENDPRITIQNGDTLLQKFRGAEVVVRQPLKVLSAGDLEHAVVIPRCASVDVAAAIPKARVPPRVRAADLFGPVCGRVIGNDYLKILEGLG
jgi:hypothetical protein